MASSQGVSNVYLDVEFSSGSSLDAGSGDINIQTVNTSGTVLSTHEVDSGSDSGVLNGVKEGSRVRVDVDSDAYDAQAALVALTFRSGSSTGDVIARATVQTVPEPFRFTPTRWPLTAPATSGPFPRR